MNQLYSSSFCLTLEHFDGMFGHGLRLSIDWCDDKKSRIEFGDGENVIDDSFHMLSTLSYRLSGI